MAEEQDEASFHISVLTLAEYDKGIHNLRDDHPDRSRYMAARDALAERFGPRVRRSMTRSLGAGAGFLGKASAPAAMHRR